MPYSVAGEPPKRWHRTIPEYRAWSRDHRMRGKPRIFAEGDSWFSYPRKHLVAGKPANLMQHLASRHRRLILLFSESGDTMRNILSKRNRKRMLGAVRNNDFDLFLFSGGGNDFAGKGTFGKYLKPGGSEATSWVHQTDAGKLFSELRRDFDGFVREALREADNPQMRMMIHTYDLPYPRNKGLTLLGHTLGPWLWPDLDKTGVPAELHRDVARWFLDRWADELHRLRDGLPADLRARFDVVETRGTLDDVRQWKDEIHPTSSGFKKLARKLKAAAPEFLD